MIEPGDFGKENRSEKGFAGPTASLAEPGRAWASIQMLLLLLDLLPSCQPSFFTFHVKEREGLRTYYSIVRYFLSRSSIHEQGKTDCLRSAGRFTLAGRRSSYTLMQPAGRAEIPTLAKMIPDHSPPEGLVLEDKHADLFLASQSRYAARHQRSSVRTSLFRPPIEAPSGGNLPARNVSEVQRL